MLLEKLFGVGASVHVVVRSGDLSNVGDGRPSANAGLTASCLRRSKTRVLGKCFIEKKDMNCDQETDGTTSSEGSFAQDAVPYLDRSRCFAVRRL